MAQRRMFSKSIARSDAFLSMSLTAQALYFHLGLEADDEGFLDNAKSIQRTIQAADDDFKILIAKGFIIKFRNGIVVIKHWKINNYIQADRFHETQFLNEKKQIICSQNGSYEIAGYGMDTKCIQDGYRMDTEHRLGKYSIYKNSNSINTERLNNSKILSPKGDLNKKIIAIFKEFGIDENRWQELSTYGEKRVLECAAAVKLKKDIRNPGGLLIDFLVNKKTLPKSLTELNQKSAQELQKYKEKAKEFCSTCRKFVNNKNIFCSHDGMRLDIETHKQIKCEFYKAVNDNG